MAKPRDSISNRLKQALNLRCLKPIELSKKANIDKALISHYLKGTYKPGNENTTKLAKALNVNEAWLMGYDIPMENNVSSNNDTFVILDNNKILSAKDMEFINLPEEEKDLLFSLMEAAKKALDKKEHK